MKATRVLLMSVSLAISTARVFAVDPVPPVATPVAPASTNAPQVSLANEIFDFGKVSSGEKITNQFVFTNTGTAVLMISNVQPACHCTSAGEWTKEVAPGKTGVIPLVLDSTSFYGPITRTVSVTCNDPRRPIFSLTMKGNVWRPIEVSPVNAIFNVASDVETVEPVVLHITNNLDGPVTLNEPTCPNQSFTAELKTVVPGKAFDLVVKLKTPINSTGISGMITVGTTSPKAPAISVSAFVIVHPAVAMVPSQINLMPGPLAVATTNYITIVNSSTNHPKLALSELTGPTNGVTLRMTEIQPGKQFTIGVGFPAGYQVPAGMTPAITFKTAHPQYSQVRIPIVQPNSPPAYAAPRPAELAVPVIVGTESQEGLRAGGRTRSPVPASIGTNPPVIPASIGTNPPPLPPIHATAAKGQ